MNNFWRKYRSAICLSGFLLLVGCAGSPVRIGMMSDEDLDRTSGAELCNAYAVNGHSSEKLKNALLRRDQELARMKANNEPDPATGQIPRPPFTDREWEAIDRGNIFVGMSEMGLICAWGWPGLYGTINTTTTQYASSKQYVYRAYDFSKGNYVYVENGRITAIQQ